MPNVPFNSLFLDKEKLKFAGVAAGDVGKAGVHEFFDTLAMLAIYEGGQKFVENVTSEMEEGILKEALTNSLSVMTYSIAGKFLNLQEIVLDKVLAGSKKLAILFLIGLSTKVKGKMRKYRAIKGMRGILRRFNFFNTAKMNGAQIAHVVSDFANADVSMNLASSQRSSFMGQNVQGIQNMLMQKQQQNLSFAKGIHESSYRSFFLKLFSGNFQARDRVMLQKMTHSKFTENHIEALNAVSGFMFSKDNEGNVIGLSDSFMGLVNAIGYYNK